MTDKPLNPPQGWISFRNGQMEECQEPKLPHSYDGDDFDEFLKRCGFALEERFGDQCGWHVDLFAKATEGSYAWIAVISTTDYWTPVYLDSWANFVNFVAFISPSITTALATQVLNDDVTEMIGRWTGPAREDRRERAKIKREEKEKANNQAMNDPRVS